jgi:hypothetical protein
MLSDKGIKGVAPEANQEIILIKVWDIFYLCSGSVDWCIMTDLLLNMAYPLFKYNFHYTNCQKIKI